LHIKDPDLIDSVYIFNFPQKHNIGFLTVHNLKVKDRVKKFSGMHMATILNQFNQQKPLPVLISHQLLHGWNYVYYEMLHFGIPWVHNSEWFKSYGYYYPEMDIEAGSAAVLKAVQTHCATFESEKLRNYEMLKTIDPDDSKTVQVWDGLLRKSILVAESAKTSEIAEFQTVRAT
jgi:hypothetical protein